MCYGSQGQILRIPMIGIIKGEPEKISGSLSHGILSTSETAFHVSFDRHSIIVKRNTEEEQRHVTMPLLESLNPRSCYILKSKPNILLIYGLYIYTNQMIAL